MFPIHGNLADYAWGSGGLDSVVTQVGVTSIVRVHAFHAYHCLSCFFCRRQVCRRPSVCDRIDWRLHGLNIWNLVFELHHLSMNIVFKRVRCFLPAPWPASATVCGKRRSLSFCRCTLQTVGYNSVSPYPSTTLTQLYCH